MVLPGPSRMTVTRLRTTDTEISLGQIIGADLDKGAKIQEWIYTPEINRSVSVQADVDMEHGGIVYALDVHFDPTNTRDDKFVLWREVRANKAPFLTNICYSITHD